MSRTTTLPPILLLLTVACGPEEAADRGRSLFSDPHFSQSQANVFSCATCHSVAPDGGGEVRYAGHTLHGAAARPHFWAGRLDIFLDAVNQCRVDFMRGERLEPGETEGLALLAYLRSLAFSPDVARPCTVVPTIDESYLRGLPVGDADRGGGLFGAACAPCHGALHDGKGRLSARIPIVPEDTVAVFGAGHARAIIVEKVRHGKYFSISGVMPFYCTEVLSDAELGDLLTYILK